MTQTRLLCALALLLTVGCGPDVADDAGGAPLRTISRAATPVAQGASFQTNEDVPFSGQLQAADDDGHPLTFLIVNDGSIGSVTLDDPNTGAFTYTPQQDAFGSDSFDFQATDGEFSSEVATITITITPINDPPVIHTLDGPRSANEGDALAFTATFSDPEGQPLTTFWDFGDGQEVNGVNLAQVQHTFTNQGVFGVTLLALDPGNSIASRFVPVRVSNVAPTVDAGDDVEVDQGEAVSFSGQASDPGADTLTFCWDFGDGSPEVCGVDLGDVEHTFNVPGVFAVTLTVDDGTAQTSNVLTATVNGVGPDVDIEVSPNPVAEGRPTRLSIALDDLSQSEVTLTIDYGDGQREVIGGLQPPYGVLERSYAYAQEGTYLLRVVARNRGGFEGLAQAQVQVNNVAPQVTLPGASGQEGAPITLSAAAVDVPADALRFTWNFGDGAPPVETAEPTVTHTYAQEGRYTLSLSVFDGTAATAQVAQVSVVNVLPTVELAARDGIEGVPVIFSATASDPGADTLIYCWTFGDGTPERCGADLASVEHTFANVGSYRLLLKVRDGTGEVTREATVQIVNARDNDAPGDPVALSPAFEASVGVDGLVFIARGALDVDREEEGLRYDLRLSTSASFEAEAVVAEVEGLEAGPGGEVVWDLRREALALAEDGVHHWDVRVRDREGLGGRAISRFVLSDQDGAPGPVRLESPTEGARVRTTAPALVWGGGDDPEGARVTYTLEVAEESDFERPILAKAGIARQGASTTWLGAALPDDSALFWRVRAVDAAGQPGPWSAPGGFVVDQVDAAPAAPTPLSPREGVLLESGEAVALVWATVEDPEGAPVSYTVELFDASGAQIDGGDRANAPQGAAQERFELATALAPGGYFWRVRASAGGQESPWSEPASFSVASALVGEPTPARTPRTSTPLPSGCAQAPSPTGSPMGSLVWVMVLLAAGVLIRRRG